MSTDAQIPPETAIIARQRASPARAVVAHRAADRRAACRLRSTARAARIRWPRTSKLPQYLWGMAWEWILLGFTWLGIRKRITLRDLIGGRWAKLEEFFLDVIYAATFWVCALVVLGIGARADASRPGRQNRQPCASSSDFLRPDRDLELAVWFCVSATAGFCEEIIFRGYLQRQFAALTDSMLVGVLLSAVVFGASHGYEGAARMLLIGIYGLMFGLLAWWRKSLRPGMMAHAWHDAFSGVILRMLK